MSVAHSSFRELERVLLGEELPSVRAHALACDECAAHLEQAPPVSALPPIEAPRRRLARGGHLLEALRQRPRRLALLGVPALAAAIVAVWIAVPPRAEDPSAWLAAKGAPSIAIFVKRGASLSPWDGVAPFRPEDRIRLRIAPREFTHAAVAAFDPATGGWSVLFEGEVEGAEVLLPGSWELDDSPGAERLVIALDAGPVRIERAPWRREILLP